MRIRKVAAVAAAAALSLTMVNSSPAHAQPEDSVHLASNASPQGELHVIDAENHGTADGTSVIGHVLKSSDQQNQQWFLSSNGDGTITLRGKESGKCITPTAQGGVLVLRHCDPGGHPAQKWYESPSSARKTFENAIFEGEGISYEGEHNQLRLRTLDAIDDSQTWRVIH